MDKSFIRIGCDPELFCFEGESTQPISVHNLIPGDKKSPYPVPGGAIQVDGTSAEFNIDPAATRKDFLKNIRRVSNILENAVKAKNPSFSLKAIPSVFFAENYFNSLPESAKALGCEPDYNAYTNNVNPKPNADNFMRTGSGHVHIQFLPDELKTSDPLSKEHMDRCCSLVKELDAVLYFQSKYWDSDTTRQELYGKPGAFRPKSYGLEYRVLSNAWLRSSWTQMFIFDASYNVTRKWLDGFNVSEKIFSAMDKNAKIKEILDIMDGNGIPSIRSYAPDHVVDYVNNQ